MSSTKISRRRLVGSGLMLALAAPVMAACGAAASPTAAPVKPTDAPKAAAEPTKPAAAAAAPTNTPAAAAAAKPAAATKPAAAEKPADKPVAAAPSTGGAKTPLSIATYAGHLGDWERHFASEWQKKHPEVDLTVDVIPYGDMAKKQLLQIAAGNMEDITFSGIKWYPYSIFKGAFMPLDDLQKSLGPDKNDFLPSCWQNGMFEDKLYGLPYQIDNGNLALVVFNVDHLSSKGLKVPTDDWTVQDFVDLAIKANDPAAKIYGANYLPTTFYDFASLSRTWGTDIFSPDSKKLLLNTDPKNIEAARWLTELRTKHKVAPNREETKGAEFAAGRLASTNDSISGIQTLTETVGTKFKWDLALFPKGPTGLRGYHTFSEMWSIYSKSKQAEKAYDLMLLLSSTEAGVYAALQSQYGPNCRKSVWADERVLKSNPSFPRVYKWISEVEGPFPIPNNLRFSELQDKWANVSLPLLYGEVPFEEGMKRVQDECQKIMDLPRS
jgi:multiple sugar transport system substrate-binding protein